MLENGLKPSMNICNRAAYYGNYKILEWALNNGHFIDEDTISAAAESGQLDMIKWLRKRGCPWDEYTCIAAGENNYYYILVWALERGCPVPGKRNEWVEPLGIFA